MKIFRKTKTVVSFFVVALIFIQSITIVPFAAETHQSSDENSINIKTEDLILSMDTSSISAAGDFVAVLTVDGQIKTFFRDYYINQSSQPTEQTSTELTTSYSKLTSTDSETISGEETSKQNVNFKSILNQKGISNFNNFGDYKDKTIAKKSIDEIKNAILEYGNIISIKNSASSLIAITNDFSIVHFDFSQGYLEENSPYLFNPYITSNNKPVKITTDKNYFAVLYENGTVSTAVSDKNGFSKELEETGKWTNIIAVTSGENHVIGLKKDGTLVAAGINNYGQKDVGSFTGVANISASNNHTAVLFSNGTVKATGNNSNGQCDVNDFNNIVSIDTSETGTVGLRCNGTVAYAGAGEEIKREVAFWENIVAVKAGKNFVVGVTEDGNLIISQEDKINTITLEGVSLNINETKSLKETRMKLKQAYDKNSSNNQNKIQQQEIDQRDKEWRMIAVVVLMVAFLVIVVIYSVVLRTKNKRI